MPDARRKPDFLLIGAQKSGTSWLWDKLEQHPGTDLPTTKEIHFFGGSENYRQGIDQYLANFAHCDPALVTGEASTSYFYDAMPFWFNSGRELLHDDELETIPRLVARELPDARIMVVMRDPVARALSAYRHWMRKGELPPLAGLQKTAVEHPKLRIVEYGNYAQHLGAWLEVFPREQVLALTFEDDIKGEGARGLEMVYEFLGLEPGFNPPERDRGVHKSWSWTHSAISYYSGPLARHINNSKLGSYLDRHDFLGRFALRASDIEFLRDIYLPQKETLSQMIGRSLSSWSYGEDILATMK